MKKREKILAAFVGGIIAVFAIGFGARNFFMKPLKEI
jgi:hypothetical protein